MAYNRKNYLKRVLAIQEIALHHRAQGLFFKVIFHLYVESQYQISKRTFDSYMGVNARKELKEIEAMEKLNETKKIQASDMTECPDCLQPTSQEELKTFGGLCEDCNTGL